MYSDKKISDVLEYLYKQDKKELAEVVLRELRQQKEVIRETIVQPTKTQTQTNPYTPPYEITCNQG